MNKFVSLFIVSSIAISTSCSTNITPIDQEISISSNKLSFYQMEKNKYKTDVRKNSTTRGTTTGNIKYHTLKTKLLKSNSRELVVYLPPSYTSSSTKKYPVFYMHDGQNIFDKATGAFGKEWYVDEKVEYLIQKNVIEEIIIVGVYNGLDQRINEYTYTPNSEHGGGNGKNYLDFLVKEVKPFIDKTYRTKSDRDNTAIGGSSLGGLISTYAAINYPNTFAKIASMSPSYWWNDGEAIRDSQNLKNNLTFWFDAGSREGSDPSVMVNFVNKMSSLAESKVGKENVLTYIDDDAGHNEEAWAERIHGPIIHFFGKEKNFNKKADLINRLMTLEEWSKI
jgi:predicted alpha/beta superfamily hydrolase